MAGECAPPKQRGDAKSEPRFGPDRTVDSTTSTHARYRYVDMTASSRAASTSSLDTRTCGVHAQAAHPSVAKSATIAGATARPTPACTSAPFSTEVPLLKLPKLTRRSPWSPRGSRWSPRFPVVPRGPPWSPVVPSGPQGPGASRLINSLSERPQTQQQGRAGREFRPRND